MTRLLVLGGAQMVGSALIDAALDSGADVTTFSRGVSGPPYRESEVTWVRGDRTDPEALRQLASTGPWSRIVDVSPQVPRDVVAASRALSGSADSYVAVSSISSQFGASEPPITVDSPTHPGDPDAGPDGGDYSVLKAGVEAAALREWGDRAVIVRPGVILGDARDLDRLSVYVGAAMRGGQVEFPGDPGRAFQSVDVRDLAVLCWAAPPGAYNVIDAPVTWGDVAAALVAAAAAHGVVVEPVWVDDATLLERGNEPWSGALPLWLPPDDPDGAIFANVGRATLDGSAGRPLTATIARTWDHLSAR